MNKNPVSHFEIYADEPESLAKFYGSLFDWKMEKVEAGAGTDYRTVHTIDTDDKGRPTGQTGGINGGIVKRPAGFAGSTVNYVSVDSVDGALERAQKLGAKVSRGRTAVPNMGWFAILSDPQGNPFALWEADKKAH
jgi:predicted enzyme related to lactoylglutathione lyase